MPSSIASVVPLLLLAAPSPPCQPAIDLDPDAGEASHVARRDGKLVWTAERGASLALCPVGPAPGTWELAIFADATGDAPAIRAKLWDAALSRSGAEAVAFERHGDSGRLVARFDAVAIGPGQHVLELTAVEAGEIVLDCVGLTRTGPWPRDGSGGGKGGKGGKGGTGGTGGPGIAFLGIEMGGGEPAGVRITGVVEGSGAAAAGLEAGDVIVRAGGRRVGSSADVGEAIRSRRPGERLSLEVLRDGETLEVQAELGRRSESRRDGERASLVLDFLDLLPGQTVADLGCGSGWLSEAIAEAVGEAGLVYAVEIREPQVRRLRRAAGANMVAVYSRPDDCMLPENSLDVAMLHDVASHIDQPARPKFYESVTRALRPGGKLVIFGPHGRAREMLDDLATYGYRPVNSDELAAMSGSELDKRLWAGIEFRYEGGGER